MNLLNTELPKTDLASHHVGSELSSKHVGAVTFTHQSDLLFEKCDAFSKNKQIIS